MIQDLLSANPLLLALAVLTGLGLGTAAGLLAMNIMAYRARQNVAQRARLRRWDEYLRKNRRSLEEAGVGNWNLRTYLIGRWVLAFLGFLLCAWLLGPLVGIAGGISTRVLVSIILGQMRGRRRKMVREAVLVFTRNLLGLLKAGMMPVDALTSLAGKAGPIELRTSLAEMSRDIREMGMSEAVRVAKDKIADPLFDLLAISMIIVSDFGAPMRDLLEATLKGMEQYNALIRRTIATQRQQKTSAIIVPAAFMIFGLGAQIVMGRTGYFAPYSTLPGQVAELMALGFFAMGYVFMRFLQRLPDVPRLELRRARKA